MKDIKLRDIMDVTEKIKNGIEDKIQEISVAERILPSELIFESMHGNVAVSEGQIDNKDMCLADICDRIVLKASTALSDDIDDIFMMLTRSRVLGRNAARDAIGSLSFDLIKRGKISSEAAGKLREFANTIIRRDTLEREGGKVRLSDYVALMQALAERDVPMGYFLVNSFVAAETLKIDPEFNYLIVRGCPVVIPRKNEIVGDNMFLFADKQYLGEARRKELWLQIGISSNGISWRASVKYDFDIQANAIAASTLKDENDSN